MMAPPGARRNEPATFSAHPNQLGKAQLGSPSRLCWGCGGEAVPRPEPRPRLAPGPTGGRTSPAPSPSAFSPFLFPFPQPSPGPSLRPAGPLCPALAGATLAGAGGRPSALPFRRSEPISHSGGHPVTWASPRPKPVPFSAPPNLLGGGQGKFALKFPLIYSKIWRRRLCVIFFLFRLHPPAPPSVVSFLSLDRIRLPHCKCICEFPVEQLLIYSAPWLWKGFSGLFLQKVGVVGVRQREMWACFSSCLINMKA